jgi:aminoglycoside 3-N-acetyltransferase
MSELNIVENTFDSPRTIQSLSLELSKLGVKQGMVLLVHASLSSLGWVCGGSVSVILALETVIGAEGTLVIPAHSGDLSDPAGWRDPPVPEAWWDIIRETMPPYDLDLTPTRGMGAIPEAFRKQSGVIRSDHPQASFAAWGKHARQITQGHSLDFGLGERSPLARLYDMDGWVLLLGVEHDRNTSLHLAEYRTTHPGRTIVENGAPLVVDGVRKWVRLRDIREDASDFTAIGEGFERQTKKVRCKQVGNAQAKLMPQRALVDYAVSWMEKHR